MITSMRAAVLAVSLVGATVALPAAPAAGAPSPPAPAGAAAASLAADPHTILGDSPDPGGDRIVTVTAGGDGELTVTARDTTSVPGAVDAIRRAQQTPGVVAVAVDNRVSLAESATPIVDTVPDTGVPEVDAAKHASAAAGGAAAAIAAVGDAAACTDYTAFQWRGGPTMNWTYGQDGAGVTVAVVDTGTDGAHPDLAGRVLPGKDYIDPSQDGRVDGHGHGTHVAGIISAHTDTCGISGMSTADVLPVRVLDAKGSGWDSDVTAGIIWAADNGADLINLSLGGSEWNAAAQAAVDYARSKGVGVIAAAGNWRQLGSPPSFPGAYTGTTAVGAVSIDDGVASFSNRGDYVDVAAFGVSVLSTLPGGTWGYMSGTSQAAPHIAGAAAAALRKQRTAGAATGEQATRFVVGAGAGRYCPTGAAAAGWNPDTGWGIPQSARIRTPSYITSGCAGSTSYLLPAPDDKGTARPVLPSAPVNVRTLPGAGTLTVTWAPPYYYGTSDISGYVATATADGAESPAGTCEAGADAAGDYELLGTGSGCTIRGLANATGYTVTVAARNSSGLGPPSSPEATRTPGVAPGPVTGVTAQADPTGYRLVVAWNPPGDDGGSPVTDYTATATAADATTSSCITIVGGDNPTSCTIAGLPAVAKTYTVTVTATNLHGVSTPATTTAATGPQPPPGPVTGLTATGGDTTATLTWNPPALNPYDSVAHYIVTETGGNATCTTTTTRCTLTGLTNAATYPFTVRAVSAAGYGTGAAATITVTPTGPPPAPRGVTAAGADTTIAVTWTPPTLPHPGTISGYRATATPAGGGTARTCTTGADATGCTITGLTNNTTYTVTATTISPTATSAPATAGTATPGVGSLYVPIEPARVYDSRLPMAPVATGPLPGGGSRVVPVADGRHLDTGAVVRPDIVPVGATAVAYNITATDTGATGWLAVTPGNAATFSASAVNWTRPGRSIANGLIGKLDSDRALAVFNGPGQPVNFVIDVVGYFVADTDAAAPDAALFHPISPARAYDSRLAGPNRTPNPLPANPNVGRTVPVADRVTWRRLADDVVPAEATAVAYNIVATDTRSGGWLAVTSGQAPQASTLNWYGNGDVVANGQFAKLGPDRTLTVFNGSGQPVNVAIDIVGYFTPKTVDPGGAHFHPLTPVRAYDSRTPQPAALAPGAVRPIGVADGRHLTSGAVTYRGAVAADAVAVAYNVTATATGARGWLAVTPPEVTFTQVSTVNWSGPGDTVANATVAKLSNRTVAAHNGSSGTVHNIIDVYGYFR